ncbi:hypothetical protein [Burkholderia sp. MSMB1835]|uniref:hypothetical protein n=1 Tax=Burkholderia sp. MSMB1835 TaxID=1637876 RepID=UPI0007529CBE|nr:hypothetical protein [Burkholderia sp. MSMB1835]KVL33321.1 hypothetical protein WS96_13625 [Burkholderia sp. MSMB1835]
MRLKDSRSAIKKFLLYGPFPAPLSTRYGGGWRGILLGAVIRALPDGVLVAVLYLVVPRVRSFAYVTLILALAVMHSLFLEWHLTRQFERQSKPSREA